MFVSAVDNGIRRASNARNSRHSCVLLTASQHRIGGDERDATTDRLEWGERKTPGIAGRGEVEGKTERAIIQKKEEAKEGNKQSTKRLSCFEHH